MKFLLLLGLGFTSVAQASLLSSQLNYNQYGDWRNNDQLYFSTFNNGEQWKPWKNDRYTVDPLTLVDQINLCFAYGGGWNHYYNDCVIEDEDQLLDYVEAVEDAERFGFHFSAPAYNIETEENFEDIDPADLDWDNYVNWSPEKQLYFSTLDQQEENGVIIPWKLNKY
ncbi:hypothetical protein GW756_04155 [bacterium]|nr:hypothetical protein [bacterium]NCQ55205.1 hypothetical protein [Candidatus Parcubacteria bacterium]NCS67282.1 hypothetical protein [Candidatus Peregrinibacteria bacterium]NCS96537.1 hypothetical protein [bacterium]